MSEFSKQCPACGKSFASLQEYMMHLRAEHQNLSSEQILKMGKESKWKLRK